MKPLSRILFALALAGAVGVLFQRNALSNARSENQRLRGEHEEIGRLSRENAQLNRLRAEAQENETLRNETRELHKLRNEVRQLREQKPEWDKLNAQNQKLRAEAGRADRQLSRPRNPDVLIAKETLSDAGFGSPEAALRTLFWALREGNVEKARSCFTPGTPGELIPGGGAMATFKSLRVVAKKEISGDEVMLGVQMLAEHGDAPEELALPFKRMGGEWKLNLASPR